MSAPTPANALKAWVRHLESEGDLATSTVTLYGKCVGWFIAKSQVARLSDLTKPFVRGVLENPDLPWKAGTRHTIKSALQKWCDWLGDRQYIHGNPARDVRLRLDALPFTQREVRPRHTYTEAEREALLSHIDTRLARAETRMSSTNSWQSVRGAARWKFWRCALTLCFYTGLRFPSDVVNLQWEQLNFQHGTITVFTRKRNKRVVLPIHPRVRAALQAYPQADLYVFPGSVREAGYKALGVQFRKLIKSIELTGHNLHDIRATAISQWLNAGLSADEVAAMVGHARSAQSLAYARENLAFTGRMKLAEHFQQPTK